MESEELAKTMILKLEKRYAAECLIVARISHLVHDRLVAAARYTFYGILIQNLELCRVPLVSAGMLMDVVNEREVRSYRG